MIDPLRFALYSAGILGAAITGAAIPLSTRLERDRQHLLLSFSAGLMLGASLLLLVPEAMEQGGPSVMAWAVPGFLFVFLLERYVLVHVCAEPEDVGCEVHGLHGHPDGHAHDKPHGTVGLAAFVGLAVHTLVDGVALGAAADHRVGDGVALAIAMHKAPATLALSAILVHERYRARSVLLFSVLLALTVPAGAVIYSLLSDSLHDSIGPPALAFSAGSFLHVAVADLIPDLHRQKDKRLSLSLALTAGLAVMFAVARFGPGHHH